jgi:hypothetical protein
MKAHVNKVENKKKSGPEKLALFSAPSRIDVISGFSRDGSDI